MSCPRLERRTKKTRRIRQWSARTLGSAIALLVRVHVPRATRGQRASGLPAQTIAPGGGRAPHSARYANKLRFKCATLTDTEGTERSGLTRRLSAGWCGVATIIMCTFKPTLD